MDTALLSDHFLRLAPPLRPRLLPPFRFKPLFLRGQSFLCPPSRNRKPVAVGCSLFASSVQVPSTYGGWDDPELLDESYRSAMLDYIRNLLVSIGITERKHGLLFFLGFLSALAVSRVRASSMSVLPVSVLVFVVGFSAGAVQAGVASSSIWDFDEKVKDLRDFLKDLDGSMLELKNGLEEGVASNRLQKSKLKNFVGDVDRMRLRIVHAQRTMEGSYSGDIVHAPMDFEQGGKKSSQKPGRKRREFGTIAYDVFQLLGSLFQENITALNPSKGKDAGAKVELREQADTVMENSSQTDLEETSVINENIVNTSGTRLDGYKGEKPESLSGDMREDDTEMPSTTAMTDRSNGSMIVGKKFNHSGDKKLEDNVLSYDELNNVNASFHFMTKEERFEKMVFRHQYEHANGNSDQNAMKSINFFSESAESSMLEQCIQVHNNSYLNYDEQNGNQLKGSVDFVDQSDKGCPDFKVKSHYQSAQNPISGVNEDKRTSSSSSSSSDDDEFNQYVKEASEILRKARVYMKSQTDEAEADALFYRSAKLLSMAVSLKPMSLLAVGQLGNNYLLHGELKLKISRELRALLSKGDTILNQNLHLLQLKKLDTRSISRENLSSALADVCEECEDLLVEAGRKYRVALTIDRNDIRALYNWGLALSNRAQLIADIGPAAAADADKVYMAAIDKFDAIVTKGNTYAPEALYRWGIALQQRSHLRRNNRGEKLKLLQQAKSLFEDVLYVESTNQLAREALSSCLLELNYHQQW